MADPDVQALQPSLQNSLLGVAPQRGTVTDPVSGAVVAWEIKPDGSVQQTTVQEGTMGPPYKTDFQLVDTPKGKLVVDLLHANAGGTLIPGTEPKAAATPAPDIQIINGNAYKVEANGNLTLVQDKTQTPGYQAPATATPPAPQGGNENDPTVRTYDPTTNAWVTTPNPYYVDPEKEYQNQRSRDAALSQQKMDEYVAQQNVLRAGLIEDIRLGIKTTPQAQAELDQWSAMNTADYQAHAKRVIDIEDYNRKLPQAQAQEDRAARSAQQETNAPKVAALKGEGEQAQVNLRSSINLGVAPTRGMADAPYDVYGRMWAILNEKPAQGPQMQAQAAPTAPTPRPMPSTQFAPAAPGAAPTAPPAPYGGDVVAQANFEGMYPGQDPEAIWRAQDAARRAPAAR